MSPANSYRIAFQTEAGVFVWVSGGFLVAITKDMFFSKRFETQGNCEKAARKMEAGEPAKSAMGLLTKSISLESVRNVSLVPALGVLVVRGGVLKEPIRLKFDEEDTPAEIFETLHRLCNEQADIQFAKASVNDVPFDPQLGIGILLGLAGIGSVIFGAIEPGRIVGGGRWKFLAQFGQWVGPVIAFVIGGIAVMAAVYFTVSWWKSLPEKRFFQPRKQEV